MARRIILGSDGSRFRFRVSQPGIDAAAADLDDLIFDADNIPARVAATGLAVVAAAPAPRQPTINTLAHGASPSLCIGVAKSTYNEGGSGTYDEGWWVRDQSPNVGVGAFFNGVTAMIGEWVTPWLFEGDTGSGQVQSCGWRIVWNSSSISLYNYSYNPIRVRWAALEF